MLDAILNIWLEAYAVITYETLAHDWSFVENDKMMLIKSFFRRIIKDFRHKELLPLKMIFFVQASSKYFSRLIDRQLKLIEQQVLISPLFVLFENYANESIDLLQSDPLQWLFEKHFTENLYCYFSRNFFYHHNTEVATLWPDKPNKPILLVVNCKKLRGSLKIHRRT